MNLEKLLTLGEYSNIPLIFDMLADVFSRSNPVTLLEFLTHDLDNVSYRRNSRTLTAILDHNSLKLSFCKNILLVITYLAEVLCVFSVRTIKY